MTGQPRRTALGAGLTLLAGSVLAGCAGEAPASTCTSEYRTVATAATWPALRSALRSTDAFGRVAEVSTLEDGQPSSDRAVERVVVLLDAKQQTAAQLDVWRTADGDLRAGVWMQCID